MKKTVNKETATVKENLLFTPERKVVMELEEALNELEEELDD